MEERSDLSIPNSTVDTEPVPQDRPVNAKPIALSERERLVVEMIGRGMRVGEIGTKLKLSVKSVSTYRVRALRKLGLKTNDELIQYLITTSSADEPVTPTESVATES